MTTALVETRSPEELAEDSVLTTINNFIIVTNDDRMLIEEWIQKLSAAEKRRFAHYDPSRKKAYDDYLYHKERLDNAIDPFIAARKAAKQKCISWDSDQERIRREEQRRLEEEARKRAEQEALDAALVAEATGDMETAEAIIADPVYVPPVMAPKVAPAPSRLSAGRELWSAEVTSLMELCKAIAEGKQPISLIEANGPALNKMASALKSTMAIPGVKAVMRKV